MPSNGVSTPCQRTTLPQWRSPWHSRIQPCDWRSSIGSRRPSSTPSSRCSSAASCAARGAHSGRARSSSKFASITRRTVAGLPCAPWFAAAACACRRATAAPRPAIAAAVHRARGEQRREFLARVELPHPHRVLEGAPCGVDARCLGAAADGAHAEIQPGCVPPVEAHFLLAQHAPPLERGVVEELQAQRLLDLVGIVPVSSTHETCVSARPIGVATGCG